MIHHSSRVRKNGSAEPDLFKSITILTILSLIIILVQKLRSLPMGMDPYYYLAHIGVPQPGMPPLFFYLAGLPPVAVAFIITLMVLILSYFIFNQLGARNPLIPSLLVSAAPGLTFRMAMFEDDLIGIPIGLGAILLWLKGRKLEALGLCFIGYFVAWRGTALFAVMLLLSWLAERFKYWYFALPALLIKIRPDSMVGENNIGLIYIPIVLLGLFFGVRGWKTSPKFVQIWAAFFLFCGVMQAKWLWLAAFPLAYMLYDYISGWDEKKIKGFLILFCGLGLVFGSWMVYSAAPKAQQFTDIQSINATEIDNDWEFGHWLRYNGIEPTNDNLYPGRAIPPDRWEKEFALSKNITDGYELVDNFTWSLLLRKE